MGLIGQFPVLRAYGVLAQDMPLHDDVGGGDVMQVQADQGQVVNIPWYHKLPL